MNEMYTVQVNLTYRPFSISCYFGVSARSGASSLIFDRQRNGCRQESEFQSGTNTLLA